MVIYSRKHLHNFKHTYTSAKKKKKNKTWLLRTKSPFFPMFVCLLKSTVDESFFSMEGAEKTMWSPSSFKYVDTQLSASSPQLNPGRYKSHTLEQTSTKLTQGYHCQAFQNKTCLSEFNLLLLLFILRVFIIVCYTIEPHLSGLFTYPDKCLGTNPHASTESDSLIRKFSYPVMGTEVSG